MLARKQRKYWEKKILMETGWKTGYVLGYIFLYCSCCQDCAVFTEWICGERGVPVLFNTHEDAYNFVQKGDYKTTFGSI